MFRKLLRFCLTFKHLETKVNYRKHIKFYEIQKKILEKNKFTLLGPTTSPQLEPFCPPLSWNFINL